MKKTNRDNFSSATRLHIAKRAGWLCSFPTCRTPTVGATSDGEGVIDIGTASHVCAAAPGGPRYDERQSSEERSSAKNGIWMCRDHGTAIDYSDSAFTVKQLLEWKQQAEIQSRQRVLRNDVAYTPVGIVDAPILGRVRAAAEADLKVFRKTAKWPATSVALTLKVEGFDDPVTTSALASAAMSLDDLVLVAPPGMGKTTTLLQIAEGMLLSGNGAPILVPLGEWATEGATVLDSILRRPAFRDISEDDLYTAATQPGVVFLLDGWNELDAQARSRARVQISTLKARSPEIGLVISTRKQALDVPLEGMRIDLLPLNEDQQMQIAITMRGDAGAAIVDQAWRTAGVRELVTIPLYLTALLSLPQNAPFPKSKEEVLRHFVAAHEDDASHLEALRAGALGFQREFLEGLAAFATSTSNSALIDSDARRSVFETETMLADNGQIASKPQPDTILDVLVSNHVLMRAGNAPGYVFQHQQFQEWYASHSVERRILASAASILERKRLQTQIFNFPAWEEPILFAVERLARSGADQRSACGTAIIAAFDVDPILAAEMIFRCTEDVWIPIAATIQGLVSRWHAPGKADRAFRFMLTSGRPEFLSKVWPLITNESQQISSKALRNCARFRPSILGEDIEKTIPALSPHVRLVLLSEIASHSDMDGLDLVSAIAANDLDSEVQASVVEALAFRRADRHLVEILKRASDKTFDLIARKGFIDEVDDKQVQEGLAAARRRQPLAEISAYDRLRSIVYSQSGEDRSTELIAIISTMEIGGLQDAGVQFIHLARTSYPRAVADGLLARVRAGRKLFCGADNILASEGFSLEDDALLQLVVANPLSRDNDAQAAASVLGPNAVGRLMNAYLDVGSRLRLDGPYNREAYEMFRELESLIAHVPGASLVAAALARSAEMDDEQRAHVADLLSRRPNNETEQGRPFNSDGLRGIQHLVGEWGKRMLASNEVKRWQTAKIATLASVAPSPGLLPILKQLLDDNLRRYRGFRAEAHAAGWRHSQAVSEAQTPYTGEYQHAFMAIQTPETAAMMKEYLADEHFGELAAQVLAHQWYEKNESSKEKPFFGGVDFSGVEGRRVARIADPDATSAEAESIFAVIESLIEGSATNEQTLLAVALGIVAARLPHGKRCGTLRKLIALAPRRARASLLLNLILSGDEIDIKEVADGISETFEAAKTEAWILTQSEGYELKCWLQLLPFVGSPVDVLPIIRGMPPAQREPRFLEKVIEGLAYASSHEAEEVLFRLAEEDPRFYLNYHWRATALRFDTPSSACRIVDLTVNGAFVWEAGTGDKWHLAREIGGLIAKYPELRAYVYDLLKDSPSTHELSILAWAVAESPDADGLLLLVQFEKEPNLRFIGPRVVERVVTNQIPAEDWEGAYSIVPAPSGGLRQKLLALTMDGNFAASAIRCLRLIDQCRDEHGIPDLEPLHPDLASGNPWPIMQPDPEA